MYYFIVNPVAGGGRCPEIMAALSAVLHSRRIAHEVVVTESAGHATALAEAASKAGYPHVVAVGGDGTVLETAAGLLKAANGSLLGIIPGGTGNDYRRSFDIPMDARGALDIVLSGSSRLVDAGLFNGRPFFNIGSVGFDVAVVETAAGMKKLGALSYYASVFKTLVSYRCRRMKLWFDGMLQEKEILLSAVGIGLFYGGGMKVLPHSETGDGRFDVCVVDSISRLRIAMLFPNFPTGAHEKFPFVRFHRCEKVVIESTGEPFSVQTDGELYREIVTAEFNILPGVLKVLSPASP